MNEKGYYVPGDWHGAQVTLQRLATIRFNLWLSAIVLILVSCRVLAGSGGAGADARPVIAVVPMTTTDEFWQIVHAGAVRAGRDCNVCVLWQGPLTYNRNAQLDILETMIIRQVSALVVAPIDRNAARAAVENATRSGIPVIVIDSDLNSKNQVSFVATYNYKAGYKAAEHLCDLLGHQGNIILMRGAAGNASVDNRERGFLEAIKLHPELKLLSSNQRAGATFEESYKACENLLTRFKLPSGKTSINGIFCPNEMSTFAMLRALQDNGLIGTLKFVGFDSSPKLNAALYKGQIDCLVVQNPMRMAYLGVQTAVQYLQKKPVRQRIDTGVTLVTPRNATDPKVRELLEPDVARWLK